MGLKWWDVMAHSSACYMVQLGMKGSWQTPAGMGTWGHCPMPSVHRLTAHEIITGHCFGEGLGTAL